MNDHAATWICPRDEVDRGNLLGAANVASARQGRLVSEILYGPDGGERAFAAARRTGMLILPEVDAVLSTVHTLPALLQRARDEGWRLLALDISADSAAPSGEMMLQLLARLAAFETPDADRPVPPAALRRRVGGESSADSFGRSGYLHMECYAEVLKAAGAGLADAEHVLEWGAGCGRMTIHVPAWAPQAQITAADTDAEAIAWVGEHLPVQQAVALAVLPPSELAGDAFDVVFGHSVFSHLSVAAQDAWLGELARVTRPGGHVAVSFNGPACLTWHREHLLVELPASVESDFERDGVAFWRGDGWEDEFYDGYHTAFHRHDYVREHWSRYFEVVAIHETAALPTQDIAVLRAR